MSDEEEHRGLFFHGHHHPFHYHNDQQNLDSVPSGFPFSTSKYSNTDHHQGFDAPSNYMSFTEFLNGSIDSGVLSRAFGLSSTAGPSSSDGVLSFPLKDEVVGVTGDPQLAAAAGSTDTPITPNSSLSFSSTEGAGGADEDLKRIGKNADDREPRSDDGGESSDKVKKSNKNKGEKKQRAPRFAFMTKSEVDHLEDGYRWRKYGQKAVKNSPYPRSYYRCTTQRCGVKKRVERSFQDPSIVITTYEGQHNHHVPVTLRGNVAAGMYSASMLSPGPIIGGGHGLIPHHHHQEFLLQMPSIYGGGGGSGGSLCQNRAPPPHLQFQLPDYGLLQDMVPSFFPNHDQ